MTLDTAHSKEIYQGNGAATVFPFAFKVWNAAQVLVTRSLLGQVGETDVTAQSTITLTENGGTVTYLYEGSPLPSGATLAITRNMPFTQGVDLVSGSQFDPQVIEDALDQATAERQQVKEMLGRAVILPSTSDDTPQDVVEDIYTARDGAESAAAAAAASETAATASATKSAAQALLAEQSRGQACQCADRAEQARNVAMQQAESINVVMATEMGKINTAIAINKDDQAAAITTSRAWSETGEDIPVDTDDEGNPEYSSKHWALKSAQLLAGNASTTHKGVIQVGSGLDVAEGVVSAKVATTTEKGIARAATPADMQKPAEEITDGPAFLAAGSPALAAIMAALAGKLNIDLSNLDLTKTNAVLQRVSYETGSHMLTTTVIPLDDTIPQNTEGSQILAVDITPKSANSVFVVDVVAHLAPTTPINIVVALFKDNEPNAIAAGHTTHPALDYVYTQVLKKTLTIGDPAPHTFKVRFGPAESGHGAALNGVYSSRRFGGVNISTITITEYAA